MIKNQINTHTLLVSKNGKSSFWDTRMVSIMTTPGQHWFWPYGHLSIFQKSWTESTPSWAIAIFLQSWPLYIISTILAPDEQPWKFKEQVLTVFGKSWNLSSILHNHPRTRTIVLILWNHSDYTNLPNHSTTNNESTSGAIKPLEDSIHHHNPNLPRLISQPQFPVSFTFLQHDAIPNPSPTPWSNKESPLRLRSQHPIRCKQNHI